MKKTILTCITAFMAFPLFAQYTGPGFYRIQNQGEARRYLSIVNDKVSEESKHINWGSGTGANTQVEALALLRSKDRNGNIVDDKFYNAGTILKISGNENGFIIEAQGMNSEKLLNDFGYGNLKLKMNSKAELYSIYNGMQLDLIDYNFYAPIYKESLCGVVGPSYPGNMMSEGNDIKYATWAFKKIDNETEYFSVYPNEGIETSGKYYTTLCTNFAYQLREGMKAYYIDKHYYSNNCAIAELKEISDGKIPASTAVIIECSSNKVAENKVTLLEDDLSPIIGNELIGTKFCFIPSEREDPKMENALKFDTKKMRLLGLVDIQSDNNNGQIIDSKLAFVAEANESKYHNSLTLSKGYIPANKVYLPISNSSDAAATANGIKLFLPDEYETEYKSATSIKKVVNENKSAKEGIYTLTGAKVKEENNTNNLPRGIYIINGKKQVIN